MSTFSQAGRAKGFDDPRGHLFYDVVRLMRELAPQAYFSKM
jgi:site-specific DNA-cytosine methylase